MSIVEGISPAFRGEIAQMNTAVRHGNVVVAGSLKFDAVNAEPTAHRGVHPARIPM
jgi:hypothetical protein